MLKLPIKNYLIVGSYALGVRSAKDIDVICYERDIEVEYHRQDDYCGHFILNGRKIELLFADAQTSLRYFLDLSLDSKIASTKVLFAIKSGHITYPHREWDKHILDYHILKSRLEYSGELNTSYSLPKLIAMHEESTKDRLGNQQLPKLKGVSKDQFFDDAVTKFYDHDDIHQWFAHKEKPMYSYMQPNPELVYCSKNMWEDFSEEDKIKCVMEECYVIASERHLIPTMKGIRVGYAAGPAFRWALMRVCTTLCSGWFRQFAIDNYFNILNNYNKEYDQILMKYVS